jgi:peroxiredoxin
MPLFFAMLFSRLLCVFLCSLVLLSCNPEKAKEEKKKPATTIEDLHLRNAKGEMVGLSHSPKIRASVFFFLSPDCPLCQGYAPLIRDLQGKFGPKGFVFYGVFPGTGYSATEITRFIHDYDLIFSDIQDPALRLTHLLGATVTPEVIVLGEADAVLYSGRLDDWAWDTGQTRIKPTSNDLLDVLSTIDSGGIVHQKKTQAVGCIIEK